MKTPKDQGILFPNNECSNGITSTNTELILSKELLQNWQERIHKHQSKLFQGIPNLHKQGSLFPKVEQGSVDDLEPLKLTPLPLSFWRWPKCPHHGPAIYLVMDRLETYDSHLLLYLGETIAADRRWKGEHDCKAYLAAYSEALGMAGLPNRVSIRFWSDVPEDTRSRRKLEQKLIQRWLPPFNKETRARWSTPFTADIH